MAKKPSKSSSSSSSTNISKKKEQTPEPELTPKQLKEKKREEARARAAEARKIVTAGTNAWTGKLPAQLLNENCQKNKWQAVEYSIKGSDEQLIAIAYLGKKHPKTGEVTKVKFEPPKDIFGPQPTPLEARHYTATYVLHRILSGRNLKMMLPPAHRDLWVEMDTLKAEASKNEAWKWSDDPFTASEQHKKDTQERQASLKSKKEQEPMKQAIQTAKSTIKQESQQQQDRRIRFNSKLPMSKPLRSRVEKLLQARHGYQFQRGELAAPKHAQILKVVADLGFSAFQVKEALDHTSSLGDCLTWLLIHVPEDDLPKMFTPQHLDQSVRVANNLSVESAISRIKSFGFSEQVAISAMGKHGSLAQAMAFLTNNMINVSSTGVGNAETFWEEELESIEAIYENIEKFPNGCSWDLDNGIKIFFYKPVGYPAVCPGIGLEVRDSERVRTPKYILLDAIRRAATFAQDMLGDYMLLSIAQWLDESFEDIVKNSCKLIEISAGISGVYEAAPTSAAKQAPKKNPSRKKPVIDVSQLQSQHTDRFSSARGTQMLKDRAQLPAWSKQQEICQLVATNAVTLITGETGSGKSTQVAQFLLDEAINRGQLVNLLCTQPRRISAIGVAQRVADERLCSVGEQVGYVIRGESKTSASTQISFMTSGVLLRIIQTDTTELLENVTHILIDEVHERSLDSDFLLILLKRILAKHKTLKVVLMSATVDPKQFIDYFEASGDGQGQGQGVGYTHITGRTFPVNKVYLDEILQTTKYVPERLAEEGVTTADLGQIITSMRDGIDYKFVARVVEQVHQSLGLEEGSVLVFMSGAAEIDRTIAAIEAINSVFWALPLHASLPPADQKLVFNRAPPKKRKVVVSTNVAETSITISDIVAVIDSGRVKETLFNPESHVIKLVDSWASQAAVTQRMGRAGRVREGTCYKLYTRAIETEKMIPRPAPEMLRCSLDSLYLAVKSMGIANVEGFLASALDPPSELALSVAKTNLAQYGVISARDGGDLTPLGKHVSLLPTDPQSGKLLILSAIFGCLGRGLTITAIIGGKSPLVSPKDKRDQAKAALKRFADTSGDMMGFVRAFEQWQGQLGSSSRAELSRWCSENFVSQQACREIQSTKRQLLGNLLAIGMVNTDRESSLSYDLIRNDSNDTLVDAIIGGALNPRLVEAVYPHKEFMTTSTGVMEAPRESHRYLLLTPGNERVFFHPGSSLFGEKQLPPYLSYASSVVTTKHFISSVAPLSVYGLVFFSNSIQVDLMGSGIVVDKWTGLQCWSRIGILNKFLKSLFDQLIEKKFETPGLDISKDPVLECVLELIETDGRGRVASAGATS